MENGGTPYDVPPEDVYDRIVRKLREQGFNGPVSVTVVVAYANSYVHPALISDSRIRIHRALMINSKLSFFFLSVSM